MQSAVRALRVDHQPGRAQALLDEYLGRFPHGALAEDAEALEIEAAMARPSLATARRWALRYVNQFPTGRFRSVADSLLRDDFSKDDRGSHP